MKIKPIHLLLLGGAGLAAYAFFHKTARFVGDNAQPGDKVLVPVTSLPQGSLPAAFPQGVGYVGVQVATVSPDSLTGKIISYVTQETPLLEQPLPVAVGPITVAKNLVTSVYRGNQLVT